MQVLDLADPITIKNTYFNLYIVKNISSPSLYIPDSLISGLTKGLK